jgi:penicillin-binding protein 2
MFKPGNRSFVLVSLVCLWLMFAQVVFAAHVKGPTLSKPKSSQKKVTESQRTRRHYRHLASGRKTTVTRVSATTRRRRYHERFFMSSFATSAVTAGDLTAGEDPTVRQAAIDALGNMNGTVVAIEPTSGRVLAMVNQKLALSSGAQPCSTIKLSVALAALSEGLISKDTEVAIGGRSRINLTTALARSNNAYFEALGRKLGFEKVAYYAHEYGSQKNSGASARCAHSAKASR